METFALSGTEKPCKQCGIFFPIEWFTVRRSSIVTSKYTFLLHNTCPMCNQTSKDKKKHENRAIEKARRLIYSHGKRLAGKWGIVNGRDLVERFGWSIEQLAHDINHAYNNGCSYCHTLYRDMEHGLRDITLDILNVDSSPFYETNTNWCCSTCNSIKGQRGSSAFGLHLAMVKRWKEAKPGSEYCPQYKLELV